MELRTSFSQKQKENRVAANAAVVSPIQNKAATRNKFPWLGKTVSLVFPLPIFRQRKLALLPKEGPKEHLINCDPFSQRLQGLQHQAQNLLSDYRAQIKEPQTQVDLKNLEEAEEALLDTEEFVQKAITSQAQGHIETALAYEKVAHYCLLESRALVSGDKDMVLTLRSAAKAASGAGDTLQLATILKPHRNKEAVACEQEARCYLQEGEALMSGDKEKALNLRSAANAASHARDAFKQAAVLKTRGKEYEPTMLASEKEAHYCLLESETLASGDKNKALNLKKAAQAASHASEILQLALTLKAHGDAYKEAALAYQEAAYCSLQEGEEFALGTTENLKNAENLRNLVEAGSHAGDAFEEAVSLRGKGNERAAQAYEKVARYELRIREAYKLRTTESPSNLDHLIMATRLAQLAAEELTSLSSNSKEDKKVEQEQYSEYWLAWAQVYADQGKDAGDKFTLERYLKGTIQE
ncbi:MAG: hypothetical protein K2W99_02765 [Chthoniobacterales bacterium]|nr:hypothetical protein [Chthoniobacterales bacterium]